mmetsp:Transcript_15761/g.36491  ORF Transcript_15761/g.36491 Transcript_15761/m.36491 type:complete len:82 (+) Transcript_15761:919-1164(+)
MLSSSGWAKTKTWMGRCSETESKDVVESFLDSKYRDEPMFLSEVDEGMPLPWMSFIVKDPREARNRLLRILLEAGDSINAM